jgi:hypothetical protein
MMKRVKNLEVRVILLLLGQSDFRLITKPPTHIKGRQSLRIIFLVTWSSRGKINELAMALVKVSVYIQALAALLARKGATSPPLPPRPRYQMNRAQSEPRDGLNICLFRESNHDYLVLNVQFILYNESAILLFSRLLPTQTEEIGSGGNTSLYSEDAALESQQGHG